MSSVTEYSLLIRKKMSDLYDNTIGRLISKLFKRPSTILFLGIDNAGKTTLVNKLKNNTNHVFMPTKHSTEDILEIGNLKARIFDIGGHAQMRVAWKDYFHHVDGVVFIVDVEDSGRFNEVSEAWKVVRELEKEAPIVVLMNKIDMLGEDCNTILNNHKLIGELENSTGIRKTVGDVQGIEMVYLSIVNENTYDKNSILCRAFSWLNDRIEEKYRSGKK